MWGSNMLGSNKVNWQDIAKEKQQDRDKRIPDEWKTPKISQLSDIDDALTKEEREITLTPAYKLSEQLKCGELKVVTVVKAFCKRAAYAHQLTNCLTEVLFEDALKRAEELDNSSDKSGLLFGLPITVKDSVKIKGYDATIGFISYCNKPAESNSVFYDNLIAQGAVVISKTNIPQTLMAADSVNNVWGRTVNPYNSKYTAGGSSGGEGAVVACRGSAIGIGTDIAGSIRIPSLSCGTFGFRPASGRLPYGGQAGPGRPGSAIILPAIGPLANDPRDLRLLWQAILSEKPWMKDTAVAPVPLRTVKPAPAQLRIGYFHSFGDLLPHPPVLRAISESIDKLRDAGHEVFEVTDWPQDFEKLRSAAAILCVADAYQSTFKNIKDGNEPLIDVLKKFQLDKTPPYSVDKVLTAREDLMAFNMAALTSFNKNLPGDYDVLICPAAPFTAIPHDNYIQIDYTVMFNGIDIPSVVVPVTRVDPAVDKPRDRDVSKLSDWAKESEKQYDPVAMAGLPACIQVVGRKFHEEELLESVIKISDVLGKFL